MVAVLLSASAGAEVLFFDDFSDGVADGWTELQTGATYFVSGGWYHMIHTGPDLVTAGSFNGDQAGSMSVADYSLLTEIYPRAGEAGPRVRFDPADLTGYWLMMDPASDTVALARMDPSGPPVVLTSTTMVLEYYEYYWMRIEINESMIGGKVWQGTAGDEPSTWLLTAADATYATPGSICMFCRNEDSTASIHNDFDNIEVRDDVTVSLDAETWGGIKASLRP
jgi:hypothetical protein